MDNNNFPNYPGWKTVRKIGSGSYGAVYEIERDLNGKMEKAALKVISIPKCESEIEELYNLGYCDSDITAHYEKLLSEIEQEYQFMIEFREHPSIIRCDDIRYIQKDNGIGWDIYIRMELLVPLIKIVCDEISEEQVIKLGKDICQALIICEKHKILHCDIKPQNIFASQDGNYKLGDFGTAKTLEKTNGGKKIGTYNYMAPEFFNNQSYDYSADIYSLGMVMYWLLNERRMPFYSLPPETPSFEEMDLARHRRFAGEAVPAPRSGSMELKRVVMKACAFDPSRRYADAEEFLQDLMLLEANRGNSTFYECIDEYEINEESILKPAVEAPANKAKIEVKYAILFCAFVISMMLLLLLVKHLSD